MAWAASPDRVEYAKVKRALLQRFNLTEDGFRERFCGSAPKDGETVSQYVARLDKYWERWKELLGANKKL